MEEAEIWQLKKDLARIYIDLGNKLYLVDQILIKLQGGDKNG